MGALEAADAVVLARSVMKQSCLRQGYLASFMSVPGLQGTDPSGWHLHQSVVDKSGINLFVSTSEKPLSDLGMAYVTGLIEHGAATTALAVPTVNGYRRLNPVHSLTPDRLVWGHENRGAMIRVLGGPHDVTSHVENRLGEPAANPYLYIAAQIAAGLAGVSHGRASAPAANPHDTAAPGLPADLGQALAVMRASALVRELLGDALRDNFLALKNSEWERYTKWVDGSTDQQISGVTQWENDEYLMMY
jgi:glutamine synthetase